MMSDSVVLHLDEEEPTTAANLLRIGVFAVIGSVFIAVTAGELSRAVTLAIGGAIFLMLISVAMWLQFQKRYGTSTLRTTTPFVYGQMLTGTIETGFDQLPNRAVSIHLHGCYSYGQAFRVSQVVTPAEMSRSDGGFVRIPFSVRVPLSRPAAEASLIRLSVRTSSYPLGWGTTFLIRDPLL
jgi:hypothetical protein